MTIKTVRRIHNDFYHDFLNQPPNDRLQLRRAISIQAEGKKLLEKHAIAPSAARLYAARPQVILSQLLISEGRVRGKSKQVGISLPLPYRVRSPTTLPRC